jgi:CHASE2 domain-containing sensor protein
MTGHDAEPAALRPSRLDVAGARAGHAVLVTIGLKSDPRHETLRRQVLAVFIAILFALVGSAWQFDLADRLAETPFDMDLAYRAVANGWFESDANVPMALVDIDTETYRGWGTPPFTPRAPLAQLLEVVTRATPTAVVVDIDLSWGEPATEMPSEGSRQLRRFLEDYRGAALLVFPKRIDVSTTDGTRLLAPSPLDDVFASNASLAWAHASFETGDGGAVRGWQDWLAVCDDRGEAAWLPSVAARVLMSRPPAGLPLVQSPDAPPDCSKDASQSDAQRLLVGTGLSGPGRRLPSADVRVISAALVLDPDVARDDAQLFGDRVVFIGATHAGSGDFWLTPSGVRPGVELLASTVRYSPLQRATQSTAQQLGYRGLSLLLFGMFIFFEHRLRGPVAYLATALAGMLVVAVVLAVRGELGVFDAVEAAILLAVLYKVLDLVFGFIAEARTTRAQFGPGWSAWRKTAMALCRRES